MPVYFPFMLFALNYILCRPWRTGDIQHLLHTSDTGHPGHILAEAEEFSSGC